MESKDWLQEFQHTDTKITVMSSYFLHSHLPVCDFIQNITFIPMDYNKS